MARKKAPRPPLPAPPPAPAAQPAASATTITATPNVAPPRPAPAPRPKPAALVGAGPDPLADLGKSAWRVVKLLGSLQIAVVSLTLFVAAMAAGTVVESWYTGKLARDLVYSSWWFVVLLGVLFANILCAALKKYPWKKHQTGFLITHLGLLTMLTGGVFTWVNSTDHLMPLLDSADEDVRQLGQQESQTIVAPEDSDLIVRRNGREFKFDFNPGLLAWRSDPKLGFTARNDTFLNVLNTIAHPWPQGFSRTFDTDGARVDVLNYFPHARRESYRPAGPGEGGYPALKFSIENPMGFDLEGWVGRSPLGGHGGAGDRAFEQGPSRVEFAGVADLTAMQAKEFLDPPAAAPKGWLALSFGGDNVRLDVAKALEEKKAYPLGKDGWAVEVKEYHPNLLEKGTAGRATFPAVLFDLKGPKGESVEYTAYGMLAGEKDGKSTDSALVSRLAGELDVYYHAPDPSFGATQNPEKNTRGLLQFAVRESDKAVLFRSFHTGQGLMDRAPGGEMKFEGSGTVAVGDEPKSVWKKMNWQLRLLESSPRMLRLPPGQYRWVPENRRPGLEHAKLNAVALCRLTVGGKSAEVWVPRSEGGATGASLPPDQFSLSFRPKMVSLPFAIHLERAEQTNDPGTSSAATYTSYVRLTDTKETQAKARRGWFDLDWQPYDIRNESHIITMNEPLEHRGYKLYQTNYASLGLAPNGKPMNSSTLTVGSDFPGLQLKYLGTAMLALGIATMFYMRAYFFPRKRPAAAAAPAPEGI